MSFSSLAREFQREYPKTLITVFQVYTHTHRLAQRPVFQDVLEKLVLETYSGLHCGRRCYGDSGPYCTAVVSDQFSSTNKALSLRSPRLYFDQTGIHTI